MKELFDLLTRGVSVSRCADTTKVRFSRCERGALILSLASRGFPALELLTCEAPSDGRPATACKHAVVLLNIVEVAINYSKKGFRADGTQSLLRLQANAIEMQVRFNEKQNVELVIDREWRGRRGARQYKGGLRGWCVECA